MKAQYLALLTIAALVLNGCKTEKEGDERIGEITEYVTPLGKVYPLPMPSEKLLAKYEVAKQDFVANPNNLENIIWYGRRTAYLGRYEDAIDIYSAGMVQFPDDPHLYRHRGHRYISLRKYDKAISDLAKAGQLIEGTENEIEPDGIPNARNIPVSTLHGNIWYHLGLAYYLKHEYEDAFEAFKKCRDSGELPDNIVSAVHWLYMIQRRLGNDQLAEEMLEPIESGTDIIENVDYYNLCRFYKAIIPMGSLLVSGLDSPSSDALKYGIANWYFYNGDRDMAKQELEKIVAGKSWASFGYIAAESDLLTYYSNE